MVVSGTSCTVQVQMRTRYPHRQVCARQHCGTAEERQRCASARAAGARQTDELMDEPTDGLDPIQKSSIRAFLMDMAVSKTILMSTHILEEAELLCKKVIIMDHGQILGAGPTDEFLSENGRLEPKV